MAKSKCDKHSAKEDEPCFLVDYHLRGVCNSRAKKAGFNHPVSDKSKQNNGGFKTLRKGR